MTHTLLQGKDTMKRVALKMANWKLRTAFDWWKKRDDKLALCDENYYVGPVRVDHWEAQREIENLKNFMRRERYTEDEIT